MEVISQPGYIEEIPMYHLGSAQFLAFAQRTAARLNWLIIAGSGSTIICHTPASEYSQGEVVSVTIHQKKAVLHSKLVNELYGDEAQNRRNAELFRQGMAAVIAAHDKADRNLHPMHREKYGALIPSKSYLVTPIIVYTNVLVFITMICAGLSPLNPTAQSLLQWGGNLRPAVASGEWWRLLTYMFLHGGAMHLLMNTYALLYIGMFLEPLMGRFRFASAYLLTGVCAGLMSIVMHPFSVGVGASGAIFGLYGVFLSVLTTTHIQRTMRKTMLRSILFFVVFNLMAGLQGNTDNAAHIGGLISGLIIGYAFYPGIARHASMSRQVLITAIITVFVVLLGAVTLSHFRG